MENLSIYMTEHSVTALMYNKNVSCQESGQPSELFWIALIDKLLASRCLVQKYRAQMKKRASQGRYQGRESQSAKRVCLELTSVIFRYPEITNFKLKSEDLDTNDPK